MVKLCQPALGWQEPHGKQAAFDQPHNIFLNERR